MREQSDLLDHITDFPAQLHRILLCDPVSRTAGSPGIRFIQTVDHFQKRRLSAAGRAEDRDKLALPDRKRHSETAGFPAPLNCLLTCRKFNCCIFHFFLFLIFLYSAFFLFSAQVLLKTLPQRPRISSFTIIDFRVQLWGHCFCIQLR